MSIEDKFSQSAKAPAPISITLLGIDKEVREEHSSKVELLIFVILFGSITVFKSLQ